MPSDDYASLIRGGLKLKGSKPAGISKPKKKKSKSKPTDPNEASPHKDVDADAESSKSALQKALEDEDAEASMANNGDDMKLKELESRGDDGKTASERQYEEMRRKRLQDRLAREGVKTHKQRVEQLNKYLSTLSEHHDMPRIGPG